MLGWWIMRLAGLFVQFPLASQPFGAVFLFLYFLFSFFTKIYFRFGNLQEYTPAAPLPGVRDLAAPLQGVRDLAARQRGGRGFCAKPFAQIIVRRSLGPVARQRGGRPWPPGCRAVGSPTLI